MPSQNNEIDIEEEEASKEGSTDRLLFLSDGVFAIAITLLVLEIKVPHVSEAHHAHTLLQALQGFLPLWPSLLGFVLSFVSVGVMWANHCVLYCYIKKNDHLLTILNSTLLLVIAFIPFVTAVLADYLALPAPYPQAALVIYTGTQLLMAIAFNLLWRYASYNNHLLNPSQDPRLFEHVTKRYRFGPVIYLVCAALAFVSVPATIALITLLTLLYALPYGKDAQAIKQRLSRHIQPPRQ